ncbi:Esterase/lipase [Alkalibacterium sp. AK22]|uniref:alpha/beta hydrolase n=1 Tax=Alkalibacterium sp. AK22 TaxID=1229520 RepID=UPI00044B6A7D|nr:alpha/beta hydrolase [Alkalibacterium sp. AK22]EXJ23224.1 Esterase/lipase [Alkalibacterium sp. AK22]
MSIAAMGFRMLSALSDRKRDKTLKVDPEINAHYNIRYGKSRKYNQLDIYYPKGTNEKLPVLVNFHGGGYVYGSKKNYMHYGMYMARQGFVFVNSSYTLAPRKKYPEPLKELNAVLHWIAHNHETYFIDKEKIFFVGDSVGAQLAMQQAVLLKSPAYRQLLGIEVTEELSLRGLGLNCGLFDLSSKLSSAVSTNPKDPQVQLNYLLKDYLGKNWLRHKEELDFVSYIDEGFPPVFIMTAENDFLKQESYPMADMLRKKGVAVRFEKYGTAEDVHLHHVFHCNINLDEARVFNMEQCRFFHTLLKAP